MNSFSRSFGLVKESFNVLKKDKEIMLFPIISGVVGIALLGFLLVSMLSTSLLGDAGNVVFYPILFVYYLASYFTVIFFNTGLITCANIRMNGGDPKFSDGMNNAMKNVGKIFVWALISATVGIILRRLSERSGLLGRIIIGLIGMAWSLLTFFVVPVMIFENVSVTDSIKKSGALFKKTWGENVIGQFSMGFLFFLLGLLGLIPLIIGVLSVMSGSVALMIPFIGIAFLYWIMLAVLSASLNGIFLTALYNYASKGVVPAGFSEESIKGAWKAKTGNL
jgi:hypothetical protein